MKKPFFLLSFLLSSLWAVADNYEQLTANFSVGDPAIESINAIAFGPEGILFLGDSRKATVVAFDTKDRDAGEAKEKINLKQVDQQIAALLGTSADKISIQDMAVNPISKNIYLAIHHSDGIPVLLKTQGESWEHVALNEINHSIISLSNPVATDAKDRRGRSLRHWSIADLTYYDGKILLSGLSNAEFSSAFRSIPFPFKAQQQFSSLEIYHAAHGQYETYAPIKAFIPFELNGQPHLIAGYTCTPMVIFPMDELKADQHVKGKTVAELGNWNTPLDFIRFKKKEKTYLLLANSNRALMKIDPMDIEKFETPMTQRIAKRGSSEGVNFIALPFVNVQQMDNYGDSVLLLQRKSNGNLDLYLARDRQL
ncbi:MAG: hypothetical protein AAF985_13830 [Bacteroidota bacterium]